MLTKIDDMPASARVWIYQADRQIATADQERIRQEADQFLSQWAAHGNPLKSAYQVLHSRFLVFMVDESLNQASGCSIDASVHFVKHLEQNLNIDFFDRSKVAFILNDEVFLESISNLKSKVQEGVITKNTLTFNNLVASKEEWDENWLVPAHQTWLERYF